MVDNRTTTSACQFQKPIGVVATNEDAAVEMEQSKTRNTKQDTRLERHSYLTRDWMPRTIPALPAEVEECS
jgi:hypothetical protein